MSEEYSPWWSLTSRTALALSSSSIFFGMVLILLDSNRSGINLGRFTSNDPTEATNGRLEHLRGSALGFRNLTNYIARCLLETGGFRPRLHPRL